MWILCPSLLNLITFPKGKKSCQYFTNFVSNFLLKLCEFVYLCQFGLDWMPSTHQGCSITPLLTWAGEENMRTGFWVEIRAGRDHLLGTITGKTNLAWWKLMESVINQNHITIVRRKKKSWKHLPPSPSSFLNLCFGFVLKGVLII